MSDREPIAGATGGVTRRDILHGIGLASAASLLPGKALADAVAAMEAGATYPPSMTGMRGNHSGSWETAHQLARQGLRSWGEAAPINDDLYDLVVVGAGISGLSAAYFYQAKNPGARILILDNHDDFGGHAKRNEFSSGGHRLLGYGGSQTMESPSSYSPIVSALLAELRVDLGAFDAAFDDQFYKRNGLEAGVFFSNGEWGRGQMVSLDLGGLGDYMPLPKGTLSVSDAVAQMPLSDAAKRQLERLLTESKDCMPEVPQDEKFDYLYTLSYRAFLTRHLEIDEPEVFGVLEGLASDAGVGIDAVAAGEALFYSVLPGRNATGLPPDAKDYEPYIHHFPDGNASIARLLVRHLIPGAAPGSDMQSVVKAAFDYGRLDEPASAVRLRLSSTVVNVQHLGSPKSAKEVEVAYVHRGQLHKVRSSQVILACYHSIIPSLCPELPAQQREAMELQVKVPILYTNVALRNWEAWHRMGIGAFVAPGGYHINAMLDFPVSLGGYNYSSSPKDPIVVHMERFPHGSDPGMSKRDRLRQGRHELLSTRFSTIEKNIYAQLGEALAPGGFDPRKDIAGITVNRWAHGYSYDYSDLEDDTYDEWDDPRYPHMQARKSYGRIAIANSDADANAMMEAAIEQAHRAVEELT